MTSPIPTCGEGTSEPVGYSLGERFYREHGLSGRIEWSALPQAFRERMEARATRFIASLTYAERVGTQQAMLESVLVEALRKAEKLLAKHAGAVCGNEQLRDCEEFYRGYNAVTRRVRSESTDALPEIREALALAQRLTSGVGR